MHSPSIVEKASSTALSSSNKVRNTQQSHSFSQTCSLPSTLSTLSASRIHLVCTTTPSAFSLISSRLQASVVTVPSSPADWLRVVHKSVERHDGLGNIGQRPIAGEVGWSDRPVLSPFPLSKKFWNNGRRVDMHDVEIPTAISTIDHNPSGAMLET